MACYISNTVCYGWNRSTYSLFGWNIGKKKFDESPQTKYHEIDLPFSLSLVDKTFLRGTLSLSLSLSLSIAMHMHH
jgi:hypothetical protein